MGNSGMAQYANMFPGGLDPSALMSMIPSASNSLLSQSLMGFNQPNAAAAQAADGSCPAAATAAEAEQPAADEGASSIEAHVRRSGSQFGCKTGLAKANHHHTQIM